MIMEYIKSRLVSATHQNLDSIWTPHDPCDILATFLAVHMPRARSHGNVDVFVARQHGGSLYMQTRKCVTRLRRGLVNQRDPASCARPTCEEAVLESTRVSVGRRRTDHQHAGGRREHHSRHQRFPVASLDEGAAILAGQPTSIDREPNSSAPSPELLFRKTSD